MGWFWPAAAVATAAGSAHAIGRTEAFDVLAPSPSPPAPGYRFATAPAPASMPAS